MIRTAINPCSWSLGFGFNQGELVKQPEQILFCAGQTAIDATGQVQHEGDIRAQIGMAVENLNAVLRDAGMTLANVARLTVYTTDVDAMLANFDALVGPLDEAGVKPAQTLLGVARLGMPELLVEIEATAVA